MHFQVRLTAVSFLIEVTAIPTADRPRSTQTCEVIYRELLSAAQDVRRRAVFLGGHRDGWSSSIVRKGGFDGGMVFLSRTLSRCFSATTGGSWPRLFSLQGLFPQPCWSASLGLLVAGGFVASAIRN